MLEIDEYMNLRSIQYGACKTTYGTRHEVIHELRLRALQKYDKRFRSSFGGGKKKV